MKQHDLDAGTLVRGDRDERLRLLRLNRAVSEALARGGGRQVVLRACCQALVDHLDAAFARIWTLDPGESILRLRASAGLYTHMDGPHGVIGVGQLKIGLIAAERKPLATNDVARDPRISDHEWARREHMVAFAGHPLVVGERLVGVVALFARHALSRGVLAELSSIADTVAQYLERERTAALLSAREEQYRRVFEATIDGLVVADPDNGSIVEVNPAAGRMFGRSPARLVGRPFAALFPAGDRHSIGELLASARQQGESHRRLNATTRAGHLIQVDLKATALLSGGGSQVLCVVRDVTHEALAYDLLARRVAERTRELANLVAEPRDVSAELDLGPLLSVVFEHLKGTLGDAAAAILRAEGDHLVVREYRGPLPPARVSRATVKRVDVGLAPDPQQTASGVTMGVASAAIEAALLGSPADRPGSYLTVPVAEQGRVIALLVVLHREPGRDRVRQAELALAVAQQATVALEIAHLYQESSDRARQEERQRLARELHDSVSQDLYAIALGAQTGLRAASGVGHGELIETLHEIRSLSAGAMAEMRALIFELHPETLEQEGVVPAMAKLGGALRARHQIDVTLELGSEPPLDIDGKQALYRICQEALANVAKHSAAASVRIQMDSIPAGGLELTIADDGVGFDPDRDYPGHLGLRSMRERAEARGWSFDIRSKPGLGTTLSIRTKE